MNNIQKALEKKKNKHIEYKDNYHGGTGIYYYRGYINDLEQLIESLYNIVEVEKGERHYVDPFADEWIKKKEILSKFNDKLGIEESKLWNTKK
jgi:hypothetical protein